MSLPSILSEERENFYLYLTPAQNFVVRFGDLCKETLEQFENNEIVPDIAHLRNRLQAFYVVDNEKADLYLSPKSASEYKGKLEFAKDILGFIQDTDDPLSWWHRLYSGMLHCNYESLCKRIEEYDEEDERYEEFRQAYLDDAREAWEKYSAAREEYIKKYGCEGLDFGIDTPDNDENDD